MKNYCINRGETHIENHRVKLGKQNCKYCGAEIDVVQTSENYALFPKHKRDES